MFGEKNYRDFILPGKLGNHEGCFYILDEPTKIGGFKKSEGFTGCGYVPSVFLRVKPRVTFEQLEHAVRHYEMNPDRYHVTIIAQKI